MPSEARVVARVLPPLLLDFFPVQEIMNKVIGEFLSSQQPHPELMAQVIFKVRKLPRNCLCHAVGSYANVVFARHARKTRVTSQKLEAMPRRSVLRVDLKGCIV